MEFLIILAIFLGGIVLLWIGYKVGSIVKEHEWTEKIPKIRKDSVEKSRQVLTGQFSEQLAPYMPDFPYNPTECRFIGKPIDFIVFKGLDKNEPEEVVFVEIKTGESQLNSNERKLRDLIKEKKVSWFEYRLNRQGKKPQ
jgi:predicted Holliday junction resolvase-like endonuclease